jgi:hypothetical protein
MLKLLKNFQINFALFTFLNLLEKFLSYVAPLLILKLFNDQNIYNQVELIFSISLLANVFLDFGIKGRFIYEYRFLRKQKNLHLEYLYSYNSLIIFYIAASIIIIIINYLFYYDYLLLLIFFIRFIYIFLINFYKFFFRFYYNINYYFFLTIPVQIIIIIILTVLYTLQSKLTLIDFFYSQLIVIFAYIFLLYRKKIKYSPAIKTIYTIKKSFIYYWPILISSATSLIVMNFVKIYSFYKFDEFTMTKISFYLRILLVIQLTHVTFSGFFLKKNFSSNAKKINLNLLLSYIFLLILGAGFVVIIFPLVVDFLNLKLRLDAIFFLFMFYIFLWCLGAYVEQFISKINKNFDLMIAQIIALFVYFFPAFIFQEINIILIACSMCMSSLTYFFGVAYILNKNNIILK